MSQYENATAALGRLEDAVDEAVKAIRDVDHLLPSQVRHFNGAVDDAHAAFARIQPTRERLLQRTKGGPGSDLAIPQNAGALDGLRA